MRGWQHVVSPTSARASFDGSSSRRTQWRSRRIRAEHGLRRRGSGLAASRAFARPRLGRRALVSADVVVAGIPIRVTGKLWIDPVISIAIGLIVAYGAWGVLRESMDLAMDAVPEHIDPPPSETTLGCLPGVRAMHDLHIWGMSITETARTAHLVTPTSPSVTRGYCPLPPICGHGFVSGTQRFKIERGDGSAECKQEPVLLV